MAGEIEVAVGYCVKPRFGSQNSKPWCPDVRGHQVTARPRVQRDLQQVTRVEAEDGPPIGRQVPDLGQGDGDGGRRLEGGCIKKVVDLPGHPVTLIDGGDLGRKQEAHLWVAAGRGGPLQSRLERGAEAKQARLGRLERLGEFPGPGRVGEVAGANHGDALARRPPGQRPDVAVLAASAGEARVDVQVRVKHPDRILSRGADVGDRFGAWRAPLLSWCRWPRATRAGLDRRWFPGHARGARAGGSAWHATPASALGQRHPAPPSVLGQARCLPARPGQQHPACLPLWATHPAYPCPGWRHPGGLVAAAVALSPAPLRV